MTAQSPEYTSEFFGQLPRLQPESPLVTADSSDDDPAPISWTKVLSYSQCGMLPLFDLKRCVRYIPVQRNPNAANLHGIILSSATKPEDHLPPKKSKKVS